MQTADNTQNAVAKHDSNYTVYMHTCPNGKRYIGITKQSVRIRWGKDGLRYKNNVHFYRAIERYGWGAITHEILYVGLCEKEAKFKEKELISKYNSNHFGCGYNLTNGGDGSGGCRPSEQTKIKMSKSRQGRKPSLGMKHSKETKARISETSKLRTGWHHSEETKEKLKHSKSGANHFRAKSVFQFKLNGDLIKKYDYITQVENETGFARTNISKCCRGIYKQAYGYIWRYAE